MLLVVEPAAAKDSVKLEGIKGRAIFCSSWCCVQWYWREAVRVGMEMLEQFG